MEKIKYVEEKFNEKDSKSILQRGDVLTNIVGASIGRTAVFDLENSVAANINQAVCLIRTDTALLKPRFLSTLMNSEVLLNALHDGETSMARANISLGFVSSLEIPLPSLAEQASFVEKCDTIFAGILALSELTEQQIDLSVALKSATLAQELQPPEAA
jgi:type I restriction enzyme S subunit